MGGKKPKPTAKERAAERREFKLKLDYLRIQWGRRKELVAELDTLAALIRADPDPLATVVAGLKALIARHFPGATGASVYVNLKPLPDRSHPRRCASRS